MTTTAPNMNAAITPLNVLNESLRWLNVVNDSFST